MNADTDEFQKKVFCIINSIDFCFNQKLIHKRSDFTPEYLYLFSSILRPILENSNISLDKSLYEFLSKILLNEDQEHPELNEKKCVNRIRKHLLIGNQIEFRCLLLSQVIYILKLLEITLEDPLSMVQEKLNFSNKQFSRIKECVDNPACIKDKNLLSYYKPYLSFLDSLATYNSLPIVNVGVCAIMSAGKSSFINALLGYDYLPVRNEATTAHITSVYDNDNSQKLIGFTKHNNELKNIGNNLLEKDVNSWNADTDVSHIYLQGDLDNISNKGLIVSVHDTPGTNNSIDDSHHQITMDFLKTNKVNLLIFVADTTHLSTNDEQSLLKEIYETVISKQKIKPIFVLNKADCIDNEKESLEIIIENYRTFLSNIGFLDAKILPVSAKAARLFKMAIKGKGDKFTESENDVFPSLLRKFNKRLFLDTRENIELNNSSITLDGETYELNEIYTALIHTGIKKVEEEIEKTLRGEN